MNVKDKLAIVTGSGQGLGKAFARELLKAGASVCLSDINKESVEVTTKELGEEFGQEKVHYILCNVTSKEEIIKLYEGCEEHFGKSVDIFCNNAGINWYKGWKLCMEVNILAVMEATEYVMDRMDTDKGGKGGLIVNTASTAGIMGSSALLPKGSECYYVSKHGVVALTRSLGTSKILRDTGVRVQCICPNFADTGIIEGTPEEINLVKTKFGLMTPEYVGKAFMKLITRCNNGDALIVVKDLPPFVYSETSIQWTVVLCGAAIVTKAIFGVELTTPHHQYVFIFALFVLLHFLFRLFLF